MHFYYDGDDKINAMSYAGEMYYYVTNLQGDVTKLVKSDGTIAANYTYDAWGKLLSVTDANGNTIGSSMHIGLMNPLRYRGYIYDNETGLYYLQSRYYDPAVGRFINADDSAVLTMSTNVPLTINLFTYGINNPVMNDDPTGYLSIPRWAVSFVIDSAIWALTGGISALVSTILQPVKSIARRAGAKLIKALFKNYLKGFVKKIVGFIYKVARFVYRVVREYFWWVRIGFIQNLTSKKLAKTMTGGLLSLTANKFLNSIVNNIDVFLSIGGLIGGLWDLKSDKKLNGWIELW